MKQNLLENSEAVIKWYEGIQTVFKHLQVSNNWSKQEAWDNLKIELINSVGEGAIWVCNKNGDLENGTYITSSSVVGYGMKQDSEFLKNTTVAKITCDCTFNIKHIIKQKVKTIINEDGKQELVLDEKGNIQYEDDLDDEGNQQLEYEYDTRFLNEDGTSVMNFLFFSFDPDKSIAE